MILGIGLDLIEIDRVARALERRGEALIDRLLAPSERVLAASRRGAGLAAHVAGRFAAKEAALKALGAGLAEGMSWHDVEVVAPRLHAKPTLAFHRVAAERLAAAGATRAHLSITHGERTAAAVVVLEG